MMVQPLVLVLLSLASLLVSAQTPGVTPTPEYDALNTFWQSSNNVTWRLGCPQVNPCGWGMGTNPCDAATGWFGISCQDSPLLPVQPNVKHIELINASITGTLDVLFASAFTQLTYLNVQANTLTGLPATLFTANVRELYLDLNPINAPVPSMAPAIRLQRFDCSECGITGMPAQLPNSMQVLNLRNNPLNTVLPLPSVALRILQLAATGVSGTIPTEYGSVPSLNIMIVSENSLTGELPSEFGQTVALQVLQAQRNSLTGTIPTQLANLPDLEFLQLWANSLTGTIPPQLQSLQKLTTLELDFNQLSGEIPSTLGLLTQIKVLTAQENFLTGTLPSELAQLNLTRFKVSNNSLSGPLPSTFDEWITVRSLSMDITTCDMSASGVCCVPTPFLSAGRCALGSSGIACFDNAGVPECPPTPEPTPFPPSPTPAGSGGSGGGGLSTGALIGIIVGVAVLLVLIIIVVVVVATRKKDPPSSFTSNYDTNMYPESQVSQMEPLRT